MIIALGILANILFICGGLFRNPRHTMIFAVLGNLTYIGYYYILGLNAPIISVSVCIVSALVAITANHRGVIQASSCFSALVISVMIISNMQGALDLLVALAAWAIAAAQMNKDNYIYYKAFVMASQCLWIVYCSIHADYAMLVTCLFVLGTNSASLIHNAIKDGLMDISFYKKAYTRIQFFK